MEEITSPPWRKKQNPAEAQNSGPSGFFQKYRAVLVVAVVLFLITGSVVSVRTFLKASEVQQTLSKVGSTTPYAVKFTEVSSTSFVIEWKTKTPTIGFIKYGEDSASLSLIGQAEENPGETRKSHKVKVDGLMPGERYYVEIHSNAQSYGEDGLPLDIKTLD